MITDYTYSNKPLVRHLKNIFGENTLLYGGVQEDNTLSDTRVIITATTMDAKPTTFTNYRRCHPSLASVNGVDQWAIWEW